MEHLTLDEVIAAAPSVAPRRNAAAEGLLDTTEILRYLKERFDMYPVFAVQGATHKDTRRTSPPRNGRHLVVAAAHGGFGAAILNGHKKDRQVHVGLGWVNLATPSLFVLGPTLRLKRWKEIAPQLDELAERSARTVFAKAVRQPTERHEAAVAAIHMSRRGYLATTTERPQSMELLADCPASRLGGVVEHILRRMQQGNLHANHANRRRIKPILRPDALFHAAMVAGDMEFRFLRNLGALDNHAGFGELRQRLVRP